MEEAWRYVQNSSRGPARTDIRVHALGAISVLRNVMVATLALYPVAKGAGKGKAKGKGNRPY